MTACGLRPVPALDAYALFDALNAQERTGLQFLGPAPGGQVGAAFVRWPDGRDGVLTRGAGTVEDLRATATILQAAQARGVPVPRYDLIADVDGTVAVVQERLPGRPPAVFTTDVLDSVLGVLDRFRGVLAEVPEAGVPDLYLRHSGPGFSVHESLAAHSSRTRSLLRHVRDIGRRPDARMCGTDLVHLDLHPQNVLVGPDGAVTGIVDWDGIGRGDRRFSLVTLRFAALTQGAPAEVAAALDALLDEQLDADTLRLFWAAMSLREVDWAIRHHTEAEVEPLLDLAESRIG